MIGILGGAFDPPHEGHLALARAALEQLRLDRLLVLVVADPGHKRVHAPPEARLRMAQEAFRGLPGAEVRLDEHRYTVDLLRGGSFGDAVFLVGADEYADFSSWREPEAVLEHVRLGVGTRAGHARPTLAREHEGRVVFFEVDSPLVASREIRRRVARGEPIDGLVSAGVARAIDELGLYGGGRRPRAAGTLRADRKDAEGL